MRFLVDAQLPHKLAGWLTTSGHDAIHTLDLPDRNLTPDRIIMIAADQGDWVVVTKDNDFAESQARTGKPRRLLHVKTGNISNRNLQLTVDLLLRQVVEAFDNGAVSIRLTQHAVEVVRSAGQ